MLYRQPKLPYCDKNHDHELEESVHDLVDKMSSHELKDRSGSTFPTLESNKKSVRLPENSSVSTEKLPEINTSYYTDQKVTLDGKLARGWNNNDTGFVKQRVSTAPYTEELRIDPETGYNTEKLPTISNTSKVSFTDNDYDENDTDDEYKQAIKQKRIRSHTTPSSTIYDGHPLHCQGCKDIWAKKMTKFMYGDRPKPHDIILEESKDYPKTLAYYIHKSHKEEAKLDTMRAPPANRGYFIIHPDFVSEKDDQKLKRKKKKLDAKYWGETYVKPQIGRKTF